MQFIIESWRDSSSDWTNTLYARDPVLIIHNKWYPSHHQELPLNAEKEQAASLSTPVVFLLMVVFKQHFSIAVGPHRGAQINITQIGNYNGVIKETRCHLVGVRNK